MRHVLLLATCYIANIVSVAGLLTYSFIGLADIRCPGLSEKSRCAVKHNVAYHLCCFSCVKGLAPSTRARAWCPGPTRARRGLPLLDFGSGSASIRCRSPRLAVARFLLWHRSWRMGPMASLAA